MRKTEEQLAVEKAFENGASIEWRGSPSSKWIDVPLPLFDWRYGDYRVKGETMDAPPFVEKLDEIPWSAINPRFTHSAREPNGMIFVYEGEPEIVGGGFSKSLPHLRIDHIMNCRAGSVAWAGSKQNRKETVWLTAASAKEVLKFDPVASVKPLILDCGRLRANPAIAGGTPSKAPEVATELSRLKTEMAEVRRNIAEIRAKVKP